MKELINKSSYFFNIFFNTVMIIISLFSLYTFYNEEVYNYLIVISQISLIFLILVFFSTIISCFFNYLLYNEIKIIKSLLYNLLFCLVLILNIILIVLFDNNLLRIFIFVLLNSKVTFIILNFLGKLLYA